ncbi:hypothetical protein CFAM422_007852 [Trichoderma lentiforme]|uniref:Uncharacterized protein n=1 Tax=Trichoderma lentiforme TaxID=1567552 RepID=A0A9P4XD08_9HYPO|nr:hypothetical protein CFAM422_007852 [Trichoderma lentiforme]
MKFLLVLILLLALGRLLAGGGLLGVLAAGLVHLVEEVQGSDLELIGLLLDLGGGGSAVARLDLGDVLAERGNLLTETVGLSLVELVGVLVEGTLSVVQDAVGAVAGLDGRLALLVRLGVLLGVLNHLLDLVTGEDTAQGLDTERQGGDVEEKEILDLTRENSTLDSSTHGDSLVRVDGLGGVASEDGLDGLGNLGHTGHTTDQDDLLDVLGLETSILEGLADGLDGSVDERLNHLLKLRASELQVDVLGAGSIGSDEGQVDVGLERGRKLNLGLLSSLTDTLDSHAIARKIETRGLLELANHVADQVDIEILTTKVGVTVGGLDLEDTVLDLQDGDIESTTTKIVDGDNAVGLLLKTVGQGGSGRLVDDTEDVETGNLTGVLGALTLSIVEVSGNGNNGVLDGLRQVGLGGLLHLVEDKATNLGGRVLLVTSRDPGIAIGVLDDLVGDLLDVTLDLSVAELATDQSLGGEEGVLWVDHGLSLGSNTNQSLAILGKGNY